MLFVSQWNNNVYFIKRTHHSDYNIVNVDDYSSVTPDTYSSNPATDN